MGLKGTKELTKEEVARSFPSLQGLLSFSSKDKDVISLFFTTFFLW